jgi:cohesin loading factor subunit SCC2
MDELVGSTAGFAESGLVEYHPHCDLHLISSSVSSAVVQRYLEHILEATLSPQQAIQSAALEILTFTIKQGLAHPLQVGENLP